MEDNNTQKSVVESLIWKTSERFVNVGVMFIVSLVLARMLLPEDYGVVAILQVFINLANVFISSGFATGLIQKKDASSVDFSTMFYCSLVCSLIIYGFLYFLAPIISEFYNMPLLQTVLRVFALQIPLSAFNSIQNAYVSRYMLFKKQFISTLAGALISGAVGILTAMRGHGAWALVYQSVTAVVANSIFLFALTSWKPKFEFSGRSAQSLMKYGSRILGADLSSTFFSEIRSLIIGKVYSSADLAFYMKGQQLPVMVNSNINNTVIAVLFPVFSNNSDDIQQVGNMARKSICLMSFIVFPILFGMAAVMEPLVIFLYSEKWVNCVPYGQVLCFGMAASVWGTTALQTLKAIGRSDIVLKAEIIKKPVYLLLILIGVKVSVFGLAVAMVAYDLYGTYVDAKYMEKHVHYSVGSQIKDLSAALLLSCCMAVVVHLLPSLDSLLLTLLVKVLTGVFVYMLLSAVFRVEAFEYLKSILLAKIKKHG